MRRLHRGWITVILQIVLALSSSGVLFGIFYLRRELMYTGHGRLFIHIPALQSSNFTVTQNHTLLLAIQAARLRIGVPRQSTAGTCVPYPRVEIGGWIAASGVAISPSGMGELSIIWVYSCETSRFFFHTGQCFSQAWCRDLLSASADGRITCKIPGVDHAVVGSRGRPIMATSLLGAQQTDTGRCAAITAVCQHRRSRIELPCNNGNTTLLTELWPSPDGGAATAVHCAQDTCVTFSRGGHSWESVLLGTNTTLPYITDDYCSVTAIVLSDTVRYETPIADTSAVLLLPEFPLYTVSAVSLGDRLLAVVINDTPTSDSFCVRWYYAPLAMRGARVLAVNGFSTQTRPAISSTMCFDIELTGGKTTVLLGTDALADSVGTFVGINVTHGQERMHALSDMPSNTLSLRYRLLTPHLHMLRLPMALTPIAVYDTDGNIRALVAPNIEPEPILLDGWLPRGPAFQSTIEYADGTAVPANLCYIHGDITIRSPVELYALSTLIVNLPGMPVQVAPFPPVALAEPGAPFFVIRDTAADPVEVTCGDTTFLMPASVPPTHCVPSAGVQNAGSISVIWRDDNAEPFLSESLGDCGLVSHHSSFGIQVSDQFCVPLPPNSTRTISFIGICAAHALEDRADDALSVEITRQMKLPSEVVPFIHARVATYDG